MWTEAAAFNGVTISALTLAPTADDKAEEESVLA